MGYGIRAMGLGPIDSAEKRGWPRGSLAEGSGQVGYFVTSHSQGQVRLVISPHHTARVRSYWLFHHITQPGSGQTGYFTTSHSHPPPPLRRSAPELQTLAVLEARPVGLYTHSDVHTPHACSLPVLRQFVGRRVHRK